VGKKDTKVLLDGEKWGRVAHMQRPLLVGEFEITLDAKNRIAVPARLRSAFEEGVYVTQENERCLGGYSPEEFQRRLQEDVEASKAGSADRRNVKRRLAASAVYFPEMDKQGRVTLPAKHLEYAGISKDVSVIGVADHVEIWDRVAWTEFRAHLEEGADASADEHATS
jgi:transcriptional regulator MraZ